MVTRRERKRRGGSDLERRPEPTRYFEPAARRDRGGAVPAFTWWLVLGAVVFVASVLLSYRFFFEWLWAQA